MNNLNNHCYMRIFMLIRKVIKKYFYALINDFMERGLGQDYFQELSTITIECINLQYCPFFMDGRKEICNYAQRKFYAFLKSYGYRRPRGQGFFVHDILKKEREITDDII